MITLSPSLRSLLIDGYDVAFPEGSTLELLDSGNVPLARFTLPAEAWAPAVEGTKRLSAPWVFTAQGAGTVVSYVLKSDAHEETGTVAGVGGDGDMAIDNTELVPGVLLTVSSFTKVA
jgi:hypothetical protein